MRTSRKTCERKVHFLSRMNAINFAWRHKTRALFPYVCNVCGQWHLSRLRPVVVRTKTRETRR